MKIIKRGEAPKDPEASCKHCGTVVSYSSKDVKTERGKLIGETDKFRYTESTYRVSDYLSCPVCSENIVLKTYTESFETENW